MPWRCRLVRWAVLLTVTFTLGVIGPLASAVVEPPDAAASPQDSPQAAPDGSLYLEPIITSGLTNPVLVTHTGDGSNRLFIVEQAGRIRIVKNGALLATPFLDVSSSVVSGGEQGFLGLAFHPQYATNGRFFVFYTKSGSATGVGDNVLAEYRASSPSSDQAIQTPVRTLFSLPDRFTNHNGGMLAFGQDGYLYVGTGDEGSSGDPDNNAQNLQSMFGKIHRLDVDNIPSGQSYGIPPTNPFVGQAGALPTIWAYGLRNPWRWSFDRLTGDQFIGDVGQSAWEEIDRLPKGVGGINLGWRDREGAHCYQPTTGCATAGRTDPILEYGHDQGCAVTGGYVYRGSAFPTLQGQYLYADYCSGRVWRARLVSGTWTATEALDTDLRPSSFGEDQSGEVYLVHLGGAIYRVWDSKAVPTCDGATFSAINPPSPQATGTSVSVTASAVPHGGATCEYRFWKLAPGGSWTVVQEWTTNSNYGYTPLGTTPGTYSLGLWARAVNQDPAAPVASAASPYTLTSPSCDTAQISAVNPPSPQAAGASVSMTASAVPHDGATCEYRFWKLAPGGPWTMVQDWTTTATFTYNPLGATPGSYMLGIWARAVNQDPAVPIASAASSYVLTAPTCDNAQISAVNPPSPQPTGTSVSVTASATPHGNATCEYRFWRLPPGGSWTVVQEWNTTVTFTYNPLGTAPGTYTIGIWARASGQDSDTTTTSAVSSYTLTGTAGSSANPASANPTATATRQPLPTPPPTTTPTPTTAATNPPLMPTSAPTATPVGPPPVPAVPPRPGTSVPPGPAPASSPGPLTPPAPP